MRAMIERLLSCNESGFNFKVSSVQRNSDNSFRLAMLVALSESMLVQIGVYPTFITESSGRNVRKSFIETKPEISDLATFLRILANVLGRNNTKTELR